MIKVEAMQTAEFNDAELVAQSLEGDREAFRQIVERYQTLISSIAYCTTGNVTQSEDLAQETFVSAWKQLAQLREPAKLRPWLCSITRFLISKEFRRQGREPSHGAESLDVMEDWVSPDPLPLDHVISDEEKAILWRSIERIPESYREPLVLFYRHHQSIEAVARDLGLSEDAVKQRLSRGRKLLEEQFLAFVAGALKQTCPSKAFTLAVIAALPLLTTSAKAATVTAAASKGSSAAKAVAGGSVLSALLTGGMMMLFSLFGVFGFVGRWMGLRMGLASRQSLRGRKQIIQFWRTLAIGFLVFVLPTMFVSHSMIHSHPWLFRASTRSIGIFYWLVAAAWILWVWQRRRVVPQTDSEPSETTGTTDKSYNLWVTLGMLGPAWIVGTFLFAIFFSDWTLSTKTVSEPEAQKIISERKDAQFTVYQYRGGSKSLWMSLPENPRIALETPLKESLTAALAQKEISYPTLVEDLDFHNGGVGGWLVLLSTFLVVAGTVLLVRRPGTERFYQQKVATPRAGGKIGKILAVCAAVAMIALSLFLILFTISHNAETISTAKAQEVISEHKDARFEVYQSTDGSKELWITPPAKRPFPYPRYIAPADEATLALLTEYKIHYKIYIQGRDFGYNGPSRWVLLLAILLLTGWASSILWRVAKKRGRQEKE